MHITHTYVHICMHVLAPPRDLSPPPTVLRSLLDALSDWCCCCFCFCCCELLPHIKLTIKTKIRSLIHTHTPRHSNTHTLTHLRTHTLPLTLIITVSPTKRMNMNFFAQNRHFCALFSSVKWSSCLAVGWRVRGQVLEQSALVPPRAADHRTQYRSDGLIEHRLEALLGQSRALQILDGGDLLGHCQSLGIGDGGELLVLQLLDRGLVVAQIQLGADQDDRDTGAVVTHLGEPLGPDVLKGGRIHQREADEEDVRLGIGERSQPVVVLLPGGIPETQIDGLGVHHHVGWVVIEHSGYVLSGKGVGRVTDQQAGLTHRSVPDDHTLDGLHGVIGS